MGVTVPRLWPGSTIVCIASGPSLTQADVDDVRGKARVIVVNDNYQKAPWADVLYAADSEWWKLHQGVPSFAGLKYSVDQASLIYPEVQILQNTGKDGFDERPTALRTGQNSGYQAVHLAVHLGASLIVLLGYDMQDTRNHWHGEHPVPQDDHGAEWCAYFQTLVAPLSKLGVRVVNCTRQTALTCFPRMSLAEALSQPLEMAS